MADANIPLTPSTSIVSKAKQEDRRFYVNGKVWGNKMRYRIRYSLPKPFKVPNLPSDCLFSISSERTYNKNANESTNNKRRQQRERQR